MNGGKRTTTVRASSDVAAYKLDPALFQALLANHPEIKRYVELEQRHRQLANFIKFYTPFAKLPAEAVKLLALEATYVTVKPGEIIFRQGDGVGPMYLIEAGRFKVWETQGARQRELAFLRQGELFGELAMVRNQPRRATVEALTEGRLLRLDEATFGKLYARFPEFRAKIEERLAAYEAPKTARLPLDFAQELLPANAAPPAMIEQVSPLQLDERQTAAQLGPFATDDGHFVKGRRIRSFPHVKHRTYAKVARTPLSAPRHLAKGTIE